MAKHEAGTNLPTRMPVTRYSTDRFIVRSEKDDGTEYVVRRTLTENQYNPFAWICQCGDFFHREKDTCKHIQTVQQAIISGVYVEKRPPQAIITDIVKIMDDECRDKAVSERTIENLNYLINHLSLEG